MVEVDSKSTLVKFWLSLRFIIVYGCINNSHLLVFLFDTVTSLKGNLIFIVFHTSCFFVQLSSEIRLLAHLSTFICSCVAPLRLYNVIIWVSIFRLSRCCCCYSVLKLIW